MERVLNELALLGFANMLDYISVGPNDTVKVDLSKLTREQAAAIGEVTVEEFTERTGQDESGKPIFENVRRTKFKLTDGGGVVPSGSFTILDGTNLYTLGTLGPDSSLATLDSASDGDRPIGAI